VKVRLRAPAKVNLELRCLGARPDGFHEVDTTLAAVGLHDELEITVAPGAGRVTLVVDGPPEVPADATNLAARAAAAMLALGGGGHDAALRLAKAIPAAAGLGGGSSDAAAAALGVALALGPDGPGPGEVALRLGALGADCPFFVAARATGLARCRGRGEEVAPLPALPRLGVLLVTPEVRAETRRVYAAWRPGDAPRGDGPGDGRRAEWGALTLDALRAALRNDLEPAALRAVVGLAAWRALLDAAGLGHARLAGSGSSFFALFATRADAEEVAGRVRAAAARAGLRPRLVLATETTSRGAEVLEEKRYG
jgi:4-diphosphocytidyl-2-C-methyl-D-erythritol kinase